MKEKILYYVKKVIKFALNPRLLICFLTAWFITNGWSYVMFGMGLWFDIPWMTAVGGAYLGLLWIPFTPEKLITVFIALLLLRWFFPNDKNTLLVLRNEMEKIKASAVRRRENRNSRKNREE